MSNSQVGNSQKSLDQLAFSMTDGPTEEAFQRAFFQSQMIAFTLKDCTCLINEKGRHWRPQADSTQVIEVIVFRITKEFKQLNGIWWKIEGILVSESKHRVSHVSSIQEGKSFKGHILGFYNPAERQGSIIVTD